jgi:hypothetical protein
LSRDVCRVDPALIRWKVSLDLRRDAVSHSAWRELPRQSIAETDKHRSIVARYVDGQRWEDTPLFRNIYRRRIASGDSVRGCTTMTELVSHYDDRVDAMHADMQAKGYRHDVDTDPIPVYLAHDGEILLGNQGNHRLAMAQLLKVPTIVVEVVGRAPGHVASALEQVEPEPTPDLPECARDIPAMTTEAERLTYYRLTRLQASAGAVVELGAWLGASTAYIAAGMRDAGVSTKAQVYDRFVWKPASHDKKAGGPLQTTQLAAFRQYLGPLLAHVATHAQDVKAIRWTGGQVSLLVCDAPKRIPEIATVLTTFAHALRPGALMAWQDFAYFPSYDIPAAMMRLGESVEYVEGVYPGTTAVFRVRKLLTAGQVSAEALALKRWKPEAVEAAWAAWGARLPEPMRPRFACGAALFLCDLGAHERARAWLRPILEAYPSEVLPKWRYLLAERGALMARYTPLVEEVQRCA